MNVDLTTNVGADLVSARERMCAHESVNVDPAANVGARSPRPRTDSRPQTGRGNPAPTHDTVLKVPGTFWCWGIIGFLVVAAAPAAQAAPPQKLHVGERLVYSVKWLGIEVGRGEAAVQEIVTLRGRPAYHIVVTVRSAPILDWIYKVRDVHHSYIDALKFHSLQYEKILREGRYRADEVMEYDQENHTASYFSRLNKSRKEMLIPPDVQDQLSCGYWFRLQEVRPASRIQISVNADEKNWDLKVKVLERTKLKILKGREWEAVEVEPEIRFQGIFVKRGKIRGWIGLDERRVPLKMRVQIPVLGSVSAELVEYTPGR